MNENPKITAKELIENLYRDCEKGTLKNSFNKLKKIDLLIIDELGHFMMDKEKESIFFQLIRHRYEKKFSHNNYQYTIRKLESNI